jgi:L-ascorbate metabolism protein UlaG (beta-lactamase superfamily)
MPVFAFASALRRAACTLVLAGLAVLAPLAEAGARQLQLRDYDPLVVDSRQPITPGQVRARFMGVSTILLDDGKDQILLDGFFSRPNLGDAILTLGRPKPDVEVIRRAVRRTGMTRLRAVLVAHAHHDHAFDTADVIVAAERTQSRQILLVGSASVRNVAMGRYKPERWIYQAPRTSQATALEVGAFRIWAIETPHSPGNLARGSVDAPLGSRPSILDYKMGPNFSYVVEHGDLQILLYPSAHWPKAALPAEVRPDVVFLGVGNLGDVDRRFADDYWRLVVGDTHAPLVIPVHWDDIQQPLQLDPRYPHVAKPNTFLDDARKGLQKIFERACASSVDVRLMPFFTEIPLTSRPPAPPTAPDGRPYARAARDPMAAVCVKAVEP